MLKEKSQGQYLYIIDGVISQKTSEGMGVKRTNKNGAEVWELQFHSITGRIEKFNIQETKVGEQLCVIIVDGSERCTLQIPVESSYFSSFTNRS
jgi:hypothetical protein